MTKDTRIVHVLNELRFSGAEMLLYSSAPSMTSFAHHSTLSTGDRLGDYAPHLASREYEVLHLPFSKSPTYFLQFWKLLRDRRFDIVHVHAERAAFWHCITARLAGKQCLRTIHNTFLFDGPLRILRGIERQILCRIGVRHIACSNRVRENELKRFGLRTQVIQNWFDPSRVTLLEEEAKIALRKSWGIAPDTFVISSIGNSGIAKNHEAILDCVIDVGDELNLHYIHCGVPSDSVQSRAEAAPPGRVQLLGATADINDLLAISDAFVSTSFFEGGPIALLEAGAAGCVCVTTNVGLANELSSEPGVTFIEPTAQSLADALRALAASERWLRESNGRRLAAYVRRVFGPEVGASAYRTAYEDLLGGAAIRSPGRR